MYDVLILAGGFGSRLKSVTGDLPKPLADIHGRPFLEVLLSNLEKFPISNVYLSLFYQNELIISIFEKKSFDFNLHFIVEPEPMLTGGAIKFASKFIVSDNFIVLNGDTYTDLDLTNFYNSYVNLNSSISIASVHVQDISRYGEIISDNSILTKFVEKGGSGMGFINSGTYLINRNFIVNVDYDIFSLEEYIGKFHKNLTIFVYNFNGYFIDIGIPYDYKVALKYFG